MLKEGVDPLVLVFRLQLASVTSKLQPNNLVSSELPSLDVVLEVVVVVVDDEKDEFVVVVVVVVEDDKLDEESGGLLSRVVAKSVVSSLSVTTTPWLVVFESSVTGPLPTLT